MSSTKVLEIDRQAAALPIGEQRDLLARIARRVERGPGAEDLPARFVSLRGLWAGQVPEDFDVEEALREIRGAWKRGLDDDGDRP